MTKHIEENWEKLEEEERKKQARLKKRDMKVSGKSVFTIQEAIKKGEIEHHDTEKKEFNEQD